MRTTWWSGSNETRTRRNVRLADATLILFKGSLDEGSLATKRFAENFGRPCSAIDLSADADPAAVADWIRKGEVRVLNVAGPRESHAPGLQEDVRVFMGAVFEAYSQRQVQPIRPEELVPMLDSAYANFRHWDVIRWALPLWYFTAAGGAFLLALDTQRPDAFLQAIAGAIGVVGLLGLLLFWRTCRYHNQALRRAEELLRFHVADIERRALLGVAMPFSLSWPSICRTATFWFAAAMMLITMAALSVALDWTGTLATELRERFLAEMPRSVE